MSDISLNVNARISSKNENVDTPVLKVRNLSCHFKSNSGSFFARKTQTVRALDGVSFDLNAGSTLGIVGESGSGKSTLARCLMRLEAPTGGQIQYNDFDVAKLDEAGLKPIRRDIQIVFQDPWSSLNPRHTVSQIISEPWEIHSGVLPRSKYKARIRELLQLVGLDPNFAHRFPNQFSGGQRQRVSIARALALSPKILILDEAVSALDVSVQAQILNLLADLQKKLNTSYLFISHDLSVVRHLCDRIGVMYMGKLVEVGNTQDIFEAPEHPYTHALLSAMPDAPEEKRIILEGEVPSPLNPPTGCCFHTRCWKANAACSATKPKLQAIKKTQKNSNHVIACHLPMSAN